jgi:trk system potassium uptake protein TrkA
VTALAVLSEGSVEVLEFTVGDGSPVLGHQIKDVTFPKGALVATILRGDNVIVPSGEDEIRAGDAIILIATADSLEAARKILQKKK